MPKFPIFKDILPNYSHITKRKAFGVLVASFLIIKLLMLLLLPNRQYTLASDLTPQNILEAVNNERSIRNLVVLNTNDDLGSAAQSKSDDMIARKYFAHIDPDGHYIWDKIVADGYTPYTMLGENLAIEFYDTDSLMAAWMNSPEHRANILQAGFRDQGMGVSFGDVQQSQYYSAITNTFGALVPTPKSQPIKNPSAPSAVASPVKKPSAPAPTSQKPATPTPILNAAPVNIVPAPATQTSTSSVVQPIEIRGVVPENSSPASNVILTPQPQSSTSPEAPIMPGQSASGVVGNDQTTVLTDYDVNRYLILIAGVALLMLMLSDIRMAIQKKLGGLDKKFNNLAILVISLVVIAFMYWL